VNKYNLVYAEYAFDGLFWYYLFPIIRPSLVTTTEGSRLPFSWKNSIKQKRDS